MIQITHNGIILDSDYTIRVDCDLIEPKVYLIDYASNMIK